MAKKAQKGGDAEARRKHAGRNVSERERSNQAKKRRQLLAMENEHRTEQTVHWHHHVRKALLTRQANQRCCRPVHARFHVFNSIYV